LARLNGRTSTRTGSPFSSWRRRRPVQHRREDSRPRATGHPRRLTTRREPRRLASAWCFF
jgi:hypothetical protein